MRARHGSTRLVLVAALAAFAFAAVTSSAMAVTIEPLNTKFTGVSEGVSRWQTAEITFECSTNSLTGTTNATKTNYFNALDAFSECTVVPTGYPKVSNSCEKEGTVPWTVTLNTAPSASLKLNCKLIVKLGGCTLTAPLQTIETGITWSTEAAGLNLLFSKARFKSLTENEACSEIYGKLTEITLSDGFKFKGLKVS
jgi:hypothetical protein